MLITTYIAALFLVLVVMNELFRRSPKIGMIFFGILPIILIPVWINSSVISLFVWAKVYSVSFVSLIFCFFSYSEKPLKNWIKWLIWLTLVLNISEAVINDFYGATLPNILNMISGIFLILTLRGVETIKLDTKSKTKDILWTAMTWQWILVYTVWNWTFVYLNFTPLAARHIAILLAPIFAILISKSTWYQARVFTLGSLLIAGITFDGFFTNLNVPQWENETVAIVAGIISVSISGLYFLQKRIVPLISDGFSWMKA